MSSRPLKSITAPMGFLSGGADGQEAQGVGVEQLHDALLISVVRSEPQ